MAALATVRVLVSVKLQGTQRAGAGSLVEYALYVVAGNALVGSSAGARNAGGVAGVALLREVVAVGACRARVAGGHGVV